MKKNILFGGMLLLAAAFTGCSEDFKDWANPISNPQPDAITIPGVSASAAGSNIDLAAAEESVKLISLSTATFPEGTVVDKMRIVMTPSGVDGAESKSLQAISTIEGTFSKQALQEVIENYYGKRPDVRSFDTHVYLDGIYKGQAAYIDAGSVNLTLIPEAPYIAQNYYIVGGTKDWNDSKEQKFNHSDADVYDDPVFTIIIDGNPDGDCWFAIGDDEGVEAIGEGVWNKLLGIVGGDNKATSGKLDFRYNMGSDNSFCVSNAKKIKVTIDMMEQTFEITKVNIADNYYLIGGPGSWDNSKNQKFTHSDKDVFDDPVFTYVFEGSGSDMWFAFGDDEAIDAVGEGVWNKLYGTTGASEDLSGNFKRRYDLDGDHSFHVDGQAKFYRFQINMAEMTYTITPLNFSEYIWEAGVNNDWGVVAQPLYCANQDGVYVGFFYAQDADWSGGMGAFKFTGAFNDWNQGNYGTGTINADGLSGTLINDGGSGNVFATPGFYQASVDLANMTYQLTPISGIGIIGPAQAGGWGEDTDMTYNKETRAWEATIELAADEFKFRANDDWAINWGGSADNLTQDGGNLKVDEAGTYFIQFFPLCETKSYCVITKK
jgi:hypothetical protein